VGDKGLQKTAVAEMDDETQARRARQAKEIDDLREVLERSREKVGVDPDELRTVFATALVRAGTSLDDARDGEIGGTPLFRLDPNDPVFAASGWPEALDDLRIRRRKRSEKLKDWRAAAPLRAVSFRPAPIGRALFLITVVYHCIGELPFCVLIDADVWKYTSIVIIRVSLRL
jgi:hypothetical protein